MFPKSSLLHLALNFLQILFMPVTVPIATFLTFMSKDISQNIVMSVVESIILEKFSGIKKIKTNTFSKNLNFLSKNS